MTIRLYLDEDAMQQALVKALRVRGVDVMTALEAGMIERPDREHLEYATSQGRVLCTFNVGHFYQLPTEYLQGGLSHAGIVLLPRQRYTLGEQLRRLLKLVATESAESMRDRDEFLSTWEPE